MAGFTPSKKTPQDFNNGVEYVDGIGDIEGDAVQAETINNVIESTLYAQEQAETAVSTAQDAKDLVDSVVENAYAPPPVGMHHIQFPNEPTPAEIWAGTSWEIDTAYQGKTIIGSGGDYTFGATGGSADAVVVSHWHDRITYRGNDDWSIGDGTGLGGITEMVYGASIITSSIGLGSPQEMSVYKTSTDGEAGTDKNMPPYIVVNYWKRTA